MKSRIAGRGMGKTTTLLWEAEQAIKEGYEVFFILPTKLRIKSLKAEHPKINFVDSVEALYKFHGKRFNNTKIFVDDLEYCMAQIIGTSNLTYSLTIGDYLNEDY